MTWALPSLPIALVLALLIGMSLGLLGSGGGIITLPVLVYVAGVPVGEAVALSLAIVGITSLVGAVIKAYQGDVDPKGTFWFALAGAVGAFPGSFLTPLVTEQTLTLIFALLMLVVGVKMLFVRTGTTRAAKPKPWWLYVLAGLAIGVLTGFLGVGGGFLIVPALVMLMGMDMHRAAGSSLVIITINSFSGLLGHLSQESIDVPLAVEFLVAAIVGMAVTSAFVGQVPERALRTMFGSMVISVGGWVLVTSIA